jgi:endonuclease/exonuclease/phosphatase family metal-dependent hydrolase
MKIISWNLLHRAGASLGEIEKLIQHEQPGLLLLQETTEQIDLLPSLVGGHYARAPLPDRRHGLAVWSPEPLHQVPEILTLPRGLLIRRVCQIILLKEFTVANVHLSHGQLLNRRQLRRIADILPRRAAILGDCNLVGPPLLPGFRDVGPRRPTHNCGNVIPLRLDRCFVRDLACEETTILGKGTSDHVPITVRLSLNAEEQPSSRRDKRKGILERMARRADVPEIQI